MTKPNTFEARLAKIRQNQPESPVEDSYPELAGERRTNLMVLGLLPAVMLAFVAIAVFLAFNPTAISSMLPEEGAHEKWVRTAPSLYGNQFNDPFNKPSFLLLPDTPRGFIRVTGKDATDPTLVASIEADWPSSAVPLPKTKGYETLKMFNKVFSDKMMAFELKSGNRPITSALYLNPAKGTYLDVNLKPIRRVLGAPDRPNQWIAELLRRAKRKRVSNSHLRTIEIAGMPAVLWYSNAPVISKAGMVPDAAAARKQVDLQITVPLNEQFLLQMNGWASLNDVTKILKALDPDAGDYRQPPKG